jgi:hypothetical protein
MKTQRQSQAAFGQSSCNFDGKLAAYLAAAGAVGTLVTRDSDAAIVANTTVQPFGINGEVNIDFNGDGQIDYQIEQNRVNLNGKDLDFLQIDKNDVNNAANPLPVDGTVSFPTNGTAPNNTVYSAYVTAGNPNDLGLYPSALTKGTMIGPASFFDFQEGSNFMGTGKYIRTNRLIDEDAGQIDANAGFQIVSPLPGSPNFLGLGGAVRYLGVEVNFNGATSSPSGSAILNYGWIGIQITNEADATGNVVGWGYETVAGQAIAAGDVGTPAGVTGDYNGNGIVDAADYTVWRDHLGQTFSLPNRDSANTGPISASDYSSWVSNFGQHSGAGAGLSTGGTVPEPGSLLMGTLGGLGVLGAYFWRSMVRVIKIG